MYIVRKRGLGRVAKLTSNIGSPCDVVHFWVRWTPSRESLKRHHTVLLDEKWDNIEGREDMSSVPLPGIPANATSKRVLS